MSAAHQYGRGFVELLNINNSKEWAIFPEENEWNELTIDFDH